jgi:hypothetical protein
MRKPVKNFKAALLSLLFLLALLPARASAAAETVASGTCGEGVVWTLDSDGVLTVSGTGDMADYDRANNLPWWNNLGSIRSLVIEEGVTGIGSSAFYGCRWLTSVSIPDGVTGIGSNAFTDCSGWTESTIPSGVTDIGRRAV